MVRRKPVRREGESLQRFPTYTLSEAAKALAIPSRTMRFWFMGKRPFLVPSVLNTKNTLLSFEDLTEAFVMEKLRKIYHVPIGSLRSAIKVAKKETGSGHPLLGQDLRIFARHLLINLPARGKRGRKMLNLSMGRGNQLAMPDVIDTIGERIEFDKNKMPTQLFPWIDLGSDRESRPVVVNPEIMSGRLVVNGTRIPVATLAGMHEHGDSPEAIANEYSLPLETVRQALRHFDKEAA